MKNILIGTLITMLYCNLFSGDNSPSVIYSNTIQDKQFIEAVIKNNYQEISKCIKLGVNINCVDKDTSKTALMIATKNGRLDIVSELIDNGADVNYCVECDSDRPVAIACCEANSDVFQLLIDKGAIAKPSYFDKCEGCIINDDRKSKIFMKFYKKWVESHIYKGIKTDDLVRYLKAGASPDEEKLLAYWADTGDVDKVKLLLKYGANPNITIYQDHSPLMLAASRCNYEIIKSLLEHGADINAEGDVNEDDTALEEALRCNDKKIIILLLSYKPNLSDFKLKSNLYKIINEKEVEYILKR